MRRRYRARRRAIGAKVPFQRIDLNKYIRLLRGMYELGENQLAASACYNVVIRMQNMIEDLLPYVRLESQQLVLRRVGWERDYSAWVDRLAEYNELLDTPEWDLVVTPLLYRRVVEGREYMSDAELGVSLFNQLLEVAWTDELLFSRWACRSSTHGDEIVERNFAECWTVGSLVGEWFTESMREWTERAGPEEEKTIRDHIEEFANDALDLVKKVGKGAAGIGVAVLAIAALAWGLSRR